MSTFVAQLFLDSRCDLLYVCTLEMRFSTFWDIIYDLCRICFVLQELEIKAKNLEEEISRLNKSLDERDVRLQLTASSAEQVELSIYVLLFYLVIMICLCGLLKCFDPVVG